VYDCTRTGITAFGSVMHGMARGIDGVGGAVGGWRAPRGPNTVKDQCHGSWELLWPSTGLVLVSVQSPSITSIHTPNKMDGTKTDRNQDDERKPTTSERPGTGYTQQ
jgi:hypothetical protein